MFRIALCLLFPVFSITSFSQKNTSENGFQISLNTSALNGNIRLKLFYYYGSPSFKKLIDSATVQPANSTIAFSTDNKILGAIYRLENGDNPSDFINIAVDNGSTISLVLNSKTLENCIADEPLNRDFTNFQRGGSRSENEKAAYLENLIKNYPNSVLALYSKFESKQIQAKAAIKNRQTEEIEEDYLGNLNLNDPRIPLLNNIYGFLFTYVRLGEINNENYIKKVDKLLAEMDCDSRNYLFYLDWIFKNISYFKQINLNETFRHTFNTYLNREICINNDRKFYNKILHEYTNLVDFRVGDKIPEFFMGDTLGNKIEIYDLLQKSEYTCLIFYDQDCHHCQKMMPEVSNFFSQKNFPASKVQFVAFRNNNNPSGWQKFLRDSNLNGFQNVIPFKEDQTYMSRLKVYLNPTVFFLNKSGEILTTEFNQSFIENILSK